MHGLYMHEVTYQDYISYISKHKEIVIEDQVISLDPINVIRLKPQEKELPPISTTVWSFPKRGAWATHRGNYRGNWAPQIPRALILMYSEPGNVILDQMIGGGTTCIEARLLGRNCIGVDINYNAVILTLHRLYYLEKAAREKFKDDPIASNINNTWSKIYHGDARNLDLVEDESIDLIATHPPYFNIIRYGTRKERVEGDLSRTRRLEEYLKYMKEIAEEAYRVLKPGGYCGILIGDTRIRKHYVPISHYVLDVFLDTGFILKEEVIKIQHKMKTTREVWSRVRRRDFLLIYHEKLFIFRKPGVKEKRSRFRYSVKQDFLKISL